MNIFVEKGEHFRVVLVYNVLIEIYESICSIFKYILFIVRFKKSLTTLKCLGVFFDQ